MPPTTREAAAASFRLATQAFNLAHPVWVLGHNDADGLSATALSTRALTASGHRVRTRLGGRGESAWSDDMRAELAGEPVGGVVVTDLGIQPTLPKPGHPTVIVDHHVPGAMPAEATVITGYGADPVPTSSLLAYWCASGLVDPLPWLWIAASGIIGDMAETAGFPEMADARRVGPRIRNGVALIRFSSAAQVHPLIAQQWRGRLRNEIVMAANTGYRPGWVHFAMRAAAPGTDLVAFLAQHRPPGADGAYGNGHHQAAGGALRPAAWNAFIQELGFGPEEEVSV